MDDWTRKPIAKFTADQCKVGYDSYDEELKVSIREIGVRNMLIKQRMLQLLQQLQNKGVQAIVMKGCHLIHSLYPFGIRPIEDIDILLHRKDYAAADESVCGMGYDHCALNLDIWTHLEVSNKLTYMNRTHPKIPVDFHFTLGPYPYLGRIPFDVLYEHSESITADSISFLVLKPEMLLVHLCLHLFQHHDEHWEISAYDLCTVTTLKGEKLDWKLFLTIVKEYALHLPVQHAIFKASSIARPSIPDWVISELHSLPASWKERRIFQSCLTMVNGIEKYIIQFLTLPGLRLKLQCMKKILFPSQTFLHNHYNGNYLKYLASMSFTTARALLRTWT